MISTQRIERKLRPALQDSEKVSNNFIIKMTESDISLHAVKINLVCSAFGLVSKPHDSGTTLNASHI